MKFYFLIYTIYHAGAMYAAQIYNCMKLHIPDIGEYELEIDDSSTVTEH